MKVSLLRFWMLMFSAILLTACGGGTGDGTTNSGTGGGSPTSSVTSLGIVASKDSVTTNGSDITTLTIRALDASNAVVTDETITLSATAGALSAASVVTDASGSATVTFDSGVETTNQVVTVTASTTSIVATKAISIIGTSVAFTSNKTSVGLSGASTATLTVVSKDGSGNPIPGQSVTLTATLGTLVEASAPGIPAASVTLTTNSSGVATATYSGGAVAGTDTVTLSGPVTDSLDIVISGSQFSLSDSGNGELDILLTDTLILNWNDDSGLPVVGEDVRFSTNNGTLDGSGNAFVVKTTDASGQVTASLAAGTTGPAQVLVEDIGLTLSDTLSINVVSRVPSAMTLEVNPTVLDPASGQSTPSAVVTATVRDASNRAVQGVNVSFSITTGPGGGEFVSPGIAKTNSAGIATVTVFSGGLTSAQNGLTIRAQVVSAPAIEAFEDFTIANQAASIQIGTTNKIIPVTINGVEAAYGMPFTVLVTDINGGAIASQVVSLSVFPLQYHTGAYTDNTKAETIVISGTFANEDQNRNGILDAGEDAAPHLDGRLTPGNVVSIPSSVTTDANGFAGFNLTYAKSFGRWIDVEVSATTDVSGTESMSMRLETLDVMANDSPYINSPFNP